MRYFDEEKRAAGHHWRPFLFIGAALVKASTTGAPGEQFIRGWQVI
jgi:hypothetical protein